MERLLRRVSSWYRRPRNWTSTCRLNYGHHLPFHAHHAEKQDDWTRFQLRRLYYQKNDCFLWLKLAIQARRTLCYAVNAVILLTVARIYVLWSTSISREKKSNTGLNALIKKKFQKFVKKQEKEEDRKGFPTFAGNVDFWWWR